MDKFKEWKRKVATEKHSLDEINDAINLFRSGKAGRIILKIGKDQQ